jgi:hypothetical protein
MYTASIRYTIVLVALLGSIAYVPAEAPVIRWGDAQEGISVGIALIQGFGKNGALAIYARPATNYAKNLVLPELSQALELLLRDSSNNLVEAKPDGTKFGAQLETKMSRRDKVRRALRFLSEEGLPLGGPTIDDCFLIKETKEYELEVRIRLVKEVRKELVPVFFTPLKTKLHLVANAIKPLPLKK